MPPDVYFKYDLNTLNAIVFKAYAPILMEHKKTTLNSNNLKMLRKLHNPKFRF